MAEHGVSRSLSHYLTTTGTAFLASDLCAIMVSFLLSYALSVLTGSSAAFEDYFELFPRLLLMIVLYAVLGLYPGILMPQPEEIKRLTVASFTGFLLLISGFFFSRSGTDYSRKFLLLAWMIGTIMLPLFRTMTRELCKRFAWWGYPVIIVGNGEKAQELAEKLLESRRSGLIPVAIVHTDTLPAASWQHPVRSTGRKLRQYRLDLGAYKEIAPGPDVKGEDIAFGTEFEPMPDYSKVPELLQKLKGQYRNALVILAVSTFKRREQKILPRLIAACFQRVVLMPGEAWTVRLSLRMVEVGSTLALSVRHNLLDPKRMFFKRVSEFVVSLILLALLLPLFIILTLLICIDSKGSAIYTHMRIGKGGRPLKVFKFRTMASNSDELLKEYLDKNPELKEEWDATQKLQNDPRITRVGRFLRRSSLDELPQIFNVLLGQMSLIGPRPIVQSEIKRYGQAFNDYIRVHPGITGLWQVSGRNNTTYRQRVELDQYYIYNWSIWLDIHIAIRTIPAILRRSGAY